MEIFDIIHGNIEVCDMGKKIIDTPEFQRLRKIKQLGCCYLVFPSAVHTRFEHSVGVYHLAKQYIENLDPLNEYFTEREKLCIRIAGLIHDIGHGPYSHLFDDLVNKDKNHEYRSGCLLKIMNTKYSLGFSREELEFILNVINPNPNITENKYKYQIISNKNGIDVDRFDYIMRDIRMTGLNYGIEYNRIMKHSKIIDGRIMFSGKVKTNIEEFFRVRFIMYKEVYNHRTVRCLEYMVSDFINQIDGLICIKKTIEEDNFNDFLEINDSIIDIVKFANIKTKESDYISKAIELVNRIDKRDIYKSVGEIELDSDLLGENFINIYSNINKDIIVDKIKISYYGKEMCEFYSNDKYRKYGIEKKNSDIFIISVYYKDKMYEQTAIKYLEGLLPLKI